MLGARFGSSWRNSTAALVVVAFALAACGTAASPGPAAGSSPVSSPAPSSGSIAEDLTFTGALAGHMRSGHRGDTDVCTRSPKQFVPAPILPALRGTPAFLHIV